MEATRSMLALAAPFSSNPSARRSIMALGLGRRSYARACARGFSFTRLGAVARLVTGSNSAHDAGVLAAQAGVDARWRFLPIANRSARRELSKSRRRDGAGDSDRMCHPAAGCHVSASDASNVPRRSSAALRCLSGAARFASAAGLHLSRSISFDASALVRSCSTGSCASTASVSR